MRYLCSKCGASSEVTTKEPKCACGGLWQLEYHPPKFDLSLVDHTTWSMFRYWAFLPLLDDGWREITLGEGMTPIIPLDENVMLKMEYFMPTLSFKDRGAALLITHCKSIGVKSVVQDSSGNAGNSVAAYSARAGIECEIYVPEGTSPKKIDMIHSHGAKVQVIEGSRDHCADCCRERVDSEGLYYANHVYNPFFYQGTKTYIYEVFEQLGRIPENIFIPLGNGTLFIGVIKGLEELVESGVIKSMPRLYGIQSEYCDPLVQAAQKGETQPANVSPQTTLAEGIAIGVPMRGEEILSYVYQYKIELITAPENRIMEARTLLALKGIYCEHTTAANYAAYLHYCEKYGAIKDCLIPMCGAGLKSDH